MKRRPDLIFFLLLLNALLFAPGAAQGGSEVGSGGDTVLCQRSAKNAFEGYYALDYILTFSGTEAPVAVSSWEASRDRLERLLLAKDPDMAEAFASFSRLLENHSDLGLARIWEPAPFGLTPLDDQQIVRRLPSNCYESSSDGKARIVQTVIRQRKPGLTLYSYDPRVLEELRKKVPLQFSYLVVHEWLWDYTSDVETLRQINALLHSPRFDTLTPAAFHAILSRLGLRADFVPVCFRSPAIRKAIESYEGKACDAIDQVTPRSGATLAVANEAVDELHPGDLSGFESFLTRFELRGSDVYEIPATFFRGLVALRAIDLSRNHLYALPPTLFEGLSLDSLDLSHNNLDSSLDQNVFRASERIARLDLSDNRFDRDSASLFDIPGLLGLDLSHNYIFDPMQIASLKARFGKRLAL